MEKGAVQVDVSGGDQDEETQGLGYAAGVKSKKAVGEGDGPHTRVHGRDSDDESKSPDMVRSIKTTQEAMKSVISGKPGGAVSGAEWEAFALRLRFRMLVTKPLECLCHVAQEQKKQTRERADGRIANTACECSV